MGEPPTTLLNFPGWTTTTGRTCKEPRPFRSTTREGRHASIFFLGALPSACSRPESFITGRGLRWRRRGGVAANENGTAPKATTRNANHEADDVAGVGGNVKVRHCEELFLRRSNPVLACPLPGIALAFVEPVTGAHSRDAVGLAMTWSVVPNNDNVAGNLTRPPTHPSTYRCCVLTLTRRSPAHAAVSSPPEPLAIGSPQRRR